MCTYNLKAQLIFPRLNIEEYFYSENYKNEILQLVELGVGGFCLFKGSIDQTAKLTTELQKSARIPLLFCADFENGLTMRLNDGTSFPHSMALGKTDEEITYKVAKAIAKEAKMLGVNWILAPVCDINNNKNNPVINIRSFGENAELVQKHISAYIKGLQEEKIIACAKHFPGHGNTSTDSHNELPILNHTIEDLEKLELLPFKTAIELNVKSIMPGHLALPIIDSSGLPATLSKIIISDLLKNKLNYQGLIITDALDMKAVTLHCTTVQACEYALKAGADILLMPENPLEAIEFINICDDTELLNQINISLTKISELKKWTGLSDQKTFYYTPDRKQFFSNEKLALLAALKSTEVQGDKTLIPLNEESVISGFAIVSEDDMLQAMLFYRMLAQAIDNDCDFGFIDENISDKDIIDFQKDILISDIVILTIFSKKDSFNERLKSNPSFVSLIDKLCRSKKIITIVFGNPYLNEIFKSNTTIYTYSDSLPSMASAIIKLSGRNEEALVS